jgi:hypothetical protein
MATQKIQPHAAFSAKALRDHVTLLDRFVRDVETLDAMLEERESRLLEYDFFRHKVAGLRASPPSDTARIPRNEGRVMEFKQQYDDATNRLRQLLQERVAAGQRLCYEAHAKMVGELQRVSDESAKVWSAVGYMTAPAGVAVAPPAHAPSSLVMSRSSSVLAAAAAPTVTAVGGGGAAVETHESGTVPVVQPAMPAPQRSRVGLNRGAGGGGGGDDPFRL